ncbi:hypothetical protein [Anaerorhabdus sp.]|uniref:hypothetical protein n=1 Tax=Anaerorhabdus sp. TaxID=1872524 RepID=UPI002FCB1361
MDYKFYTDKFKGKCTVEQFDSAIRDTSVLVEMFVKDCVSIRYAQNSLQSFGNFDVAFCYQIEMMIKYGEEALQGVTNESDIVAITTSGYKIETDKSKRKYFEYKGLPFSVISRELILNELKANGFMEMLVNQ